MALLTDRSIFFYLYPLKTIFLKIINITLLVYTSKDNKGGLIKVLNFLSIS